MAFSTQKEFFQIPLMNETIEFECRKECVKLKTYESNIDDRSWALNGTVQSNYFKDLVSCRIPKKVLEDNDSEIADEDELNNADSDAREVKKGPADQKEKDRRAERDKNDLKRQGKDEDGDEHRRKQTRKDGNAPDGDDQSSDLKLGQQKNNDNRQVGSNRGIREDGKSGTKYVDHTEDNDKSPASSRNKTRNINGRDSDSSVGVGSGDDSRKGNTFDRSGRKKRDMNGSISEKIPGTSRGKSDPLDKSGRKNDEHLSDSDNAVGVGSGANRGKRDALDKSGRKNDEHLSDADNAIGAGLGTRSGKDAFAKNGRKMGDVNGYGSDNAASASKGKSHPLNKTESKRSKVNGSSSDDAISAGPGTDSRREDTFDKNGRKMGDVNASGSDNGKAGDRGRIEPSSDQKKEKTNDVSGSSSKDRNQADGTKRGIGDGGRGMGTGARQDLEYLKVENMRGKVDNRSAAAQQGSPDDISSSAKQKSGPSSNKIGIARAYSPNGTYIGTIRANDSNNATNHFDGKASQGFRVSIPGEMGLKSDGSLIHVANTAMARLQDMLLHQNNLEKLLGDANKQLNDTTMERNELRSRLKNFKEMEWKIEELQRKAANAGRNSEVLKGSLSEQTRYIQDMEHEFLKTEDYYEQKLKNTEQQKQEAQHMVCCLKVELQKQRREAALISPLKKQNLEMSHQINRLKCALQEYDVMYKQLLKKVELFKNHGYSFDRRNPECDCMCPAASCDAISCSDSSEF